MTVSVLSEFVQVLTTVESEGKAKEIADSLLRQRLAACVQVSGPISSSYWWNDKIEHAHEWICLAKSRSQDYDRIEAAIKSTHPYELPEILAIPVIHGNIDYLHWIYKETAPKH